MTAPFSDRLRPAPVGGGFAMDDYWCWCGSTIRGEDGRYHLFASRWPHNLAFTPHWLTNSEIVRAVADDPIGPYEFAEVVFPTRGEEFWDGRMTHNPTIHKFGDTYLLYYLGTTYPGHTPTPDQPCDTEAGQHLIARANQRIGLATAKSVEGPWTRPDEPILQPRAGQWDAMMNTNPAPCVRPNGEVLLVYKAVAHQQDLLRLGVAHANSPAGPYERLADEPIFRFDETNDHVEDAYVWWVDDHYELIMKDMAGGICGERGGGIHARSDDGMHWQVSDPPQAYSRTVTWDDGSVTTQGHLERPQLLLENGVPTHLFAATSDGAGGFQNASRSWTMVIPLKTD